MLEKWAAYRATGEYPIPALHLAADEVLDKQMEKLALQRKIASDMREIWALQSRFERRAGKTPYKLLEHQRFRAGYDFLVLRCESGEIDSEIGEWWTAFIDADATEREMLLAKKPKPTEGSTAKKRAPRRGNRGGKSSDISTDAHIDTSAP